MAQLLTSLAALVVALLAVYVVRSVRVELSTLIKEVRHSVATRNALTLGELGDAAETRRISELPPEERTVGEQEHLRDVPPDTIPGGTP